MKVWIVRADRKGEQNSPTTILLKTEEDREPISDPKSDKRWAAPSLNAHHHHTTELLQPSCMMSQESWDN